MNTPHRLVFVVLLLCIGGLIFSDALLHGFVMDGQYDRRDNTMPYHLLFLRSLQQAEVPQWNPYLFCGNSLFANSTYVFFYPFNWPVWLVPEGSFPYAMTLSLFLHFLLAGLFCWLLLREVVQDGFWAMAGTFSYLLSSASIMSLFTGVEQFATFVYFPLILYLIVTAQRRSWQVGLSLLTAAYALLLLGGQVQFVLYVLGFTVLAALFPGGQRHDQERSRWRTPLIASGALALALAVAAVRYLPFALDTQASEMVRQSYGEFLRINATPVRAVLKVFMSEFFLFLNKGEYFNSYAGVFTAFFGVHGLLYGWDRRTVYWKVLVLLIALIVVGTPLAYIHYVLTGKGNLAFGRMALLLVLGLSALFAITGKRLTNDPAQLRRSMGTFVVIFAVVAGWGLSIALSSGPLYATGDEAMEKTAMWVSLGYLTGAFLLLQALLAFLLRSRSQRKELIFKTSFCLLLLGDLLLFAFRDATAQNPPFIPPPLFRSTPGDAAMAAESAAAGAPFRIIGQSEGTSHNRAIHLDLHNSSGYESVPPHRIVRLYGYPQEIPRDRARQIQPATERVMDLTATRYLLRNEGIFEHSAGIPRGSLFLDHRVVPDDREALSLLLGPNALDIKKTVVLDREPEIPIGRVGGHGGVGPVRQDLNSLSIRVRTPDNAILLLSDTYHEGWSASVDGRSAPVLRANYAFRAVAVPAGDHLVSFSFRHPAFVPGVAASTAGLLAFLAVVIAAIRSGRRAATPAAVQAGSE